MEVLKSDTNDIQARKRAKAIIDSLDPQNNGSDNCAMLCGRLVQTFCDTVLTENTPVGFAQEDMLNSYENYQPRGWDNGEDKEKYGFLKDTLVKTALNALEGIKEATYAENSNTRNRLVRSLWLAMNCHTLQSQTTTEKAN